MEKNVFFRPMESVNVAKKKKKEKPKKFKINNTEFQKIRENNNRLPLF